VTLQKVVIEEEKNFQAQNVLQALKTELQDEHCFKLMQRQRLKAIHRMMQELQEKRMTVALPG